MVFLDRGLFIRMIHASMHYRTDRPYGRLKTSVWGHLAREKIPPVDCLPTAYLGSIRTPDISVDTVLYTGIRVLAVDEDHGISNGPRPR